MPSYYRPTTLKQAKKDYKKSGASTRLSESELALIERRAVLQERADRIKEREGRRKANLKKKEEKTQRDREERQRKGLPPRPAKEGFHVGPSQLPLGNYAAFSEKGKQEEKTTDVVRAWLGERTTGRGPNATSMAPPPVRHPLQPKPANSAAQKPPAAASQVKSHLFPDDYLEDFFVSNSQIERELSPAPAAPVLCLNVPLQMPTPPSPSPPVAATNTDTADLLAQISTQDLDFTDQLTQLEPQVSTEECDFDDDLTEEDLGDIVLEYELEPANDSSIKRLNKTVNLLQKEPITTFPSRDGKQMPQICGRTVPVKQTAESDTFGLSTQDLQELET